MCIGVAMDEVVFLGQSHRDMTEIQGNRWGVAAVRVDLDQGHLVDLAPGELKLK